jgi:hypothetical protein
VVAFSAFLLDLKNVHLPSLHLFNPHQKIPEGKKYVKVEHETPRKIILSCVYSQNGRKKCKKEKVSPSNNKHISEHIFVHMPRVIRCKMLMLFNPPKRKKTFLCNDFFLLIGHQGDPIPFSVMSTSAEAIAKEKKARENLFVSHRGFGIIVQQIHNTIFSSLLAGCCYITLTEFKGKGGRQRSEFVNNILTSIHARTALGFFIFFFAARRTLSKAFDISLDPG